MNKIELAKWLHDNYEDVARQKNWNTQENCKVEYDALPDANKQTMIEIAERLLNFDLLRLHFVGDRICNWLVINKKTSSLIKYESLHINQMLDKVMMLDDGDLANYEIYEHSI